MSILKVEEGNPAGTVSDTQEVPHWSAFQKSHRDTGDYYQKCSYGCYGYLVIMFVIVIWNEMGCSKTQLKQRKNATLNLSKKFSFRKMHTTTKSTNNLI